MNMQETSVLDLADFVPVAKRSSVRPGRLHMILGAALLAAAGWLAFLPGSFLSPGALFAAFSASDSNAVAEVTFADQQAVSEMTVDDKSQLLSDGADAVRVVGEEGLDLRAIFAQGLGQAAQA